MNSFFEGIGKKVVQTKDEAVKKTKDLAQISKINSQLSEEEKKLETLYAKLGQIYYQVEHERPKAIYNDIFQAISGCLKTIHQYEVMVDELRGIRRCGRCHAEMPLSSTFCQACGNKLIEDEEEVYIPNICPDCGMENGSQATMCIRCGRLL